MRMIGMRLNVTIPMPAARVGKSKREGERERKIPLLWMH